MSQKGKIENKRDIRCYLFKKSLINKKISVAIFVVFVILAVNAFVFRNHYFNGYGFPWDFVGTYLAVPFYWIEAVKVGASVSWVPFQGMGYPLYMNLQSGYYYLPNWIFTFINSGYSINNAVYFQCLHVLFGAFGAFLCARASGLDWQKSLMVSVSYQVFGGFYSNAEHVDIIRGFSFLPWVFMIVFTQRWSFSSKSFVAIMCSIPLFFYLMVTGGYLGMLISACFVFSILVLVRALVEKKLLIGLSVFFMMLVGFLLSSYFIVPIVFFMKELVRSNSNIQYDYMKLIDVYSLIFNINYKVLPHDISMRSLSIGVVSVVVLFLGINTVYIKRYYLLLAGIILSLLMITGLMHHMLIKIIHPLGLSRMNMSDYKGILALFLILFSFHLFDNIKNTSQHFIRFALVFIFILSSIYFLKITEINAFLDLLFMVLLSIAAFIVVRYIKNINIKLCCLLIIIVLDWHRVHDQQYYYSTPDIKGYIENTFGLYSNNQMTLKQHLLSSVPRTSRNIESAQPMSYKGYYTGEYMMYDYGGSNQLTQYVNIHKNDLLESFAQKSWSVRAVNRDGSISYKDLKSLELLSYGVDNLKIKVNLSESGELVENEIYWKGWMSYIDVDNKLEEITTLDVNGFRGWLLPKGEYTLIERFDNVTMRLSSYLCLSGFILWVLALFCLIRKYKNEL